MIIMLPIFIKIFNILYEFQTWQKICFFPQVSSGDWFLLRAYVVDVQSVLCFAFDAGNIVLSKSMSNSRRVFQCKFWGCSHFLGLYIAVISLRYKILSFNNLLSILSECWFIVKTYFYDKTYKIEIHLYFILFYSSRCFQPSCPSFQTSYFV